MEQRWALNGNVFVYDEAKEGGVRDREENIMNQLVVMCQQQHQDLVTKNSNSDSSNVGNVKTQGDEDIRHWICESIYIYTPIIVMYI